MASAHSRWSIRSIKGKATSSNEIRPCNTQEHRAPAAACWGDVELLDPPPTSLELLTWCHQQTPKWWMNQLKKVEGKWKISRKSRHQFDLRVGWSCCPPLSAAVPGNLLGQSHPHDCRSAAHLAVKGMLETPRATSTVHGMWEPNPWRLAPQKWSNTYQSTLKALQFVQDWFCWLVDIKPANVNRRLWLLNQGGSFSNSDTSVHYTHARTDTDTHTHIISYHIISYHIICT